MRILAAGLMLLAFAAQAALTAPASEIVGRRVIDPSRADLGRIEELIIDVRNARVVYAVLAFGGWAGVFDKQFALPITRFTPAPFGGALMFEGSKKDLLLEPGIDSTGVPDGEEEYWRGIEAWHERPGQRAAPLRQFARAARLLGREVVDRTGERLGELRDFEVDFNSAAVRRARVEGDNELWVVPLRKVLVPSSGEEMVLNVAPRSVP